MRYSPVLYHRSSKASHRMIYSDFPLWAAPELPEKTIPICFSDQVFDLRKRSRTFFGECPYCHGKCLKKFGKEHGRQRWACANCGRTFSGRTRTILHSSKLKPSQIRRLVSMLSDGSTLRQAAHQRHMYHSRPPFCGSGRCRESRKTPETRCFPERSGWTTHTLTRRCQYGKARKGGDWQGQAIRRMLFSDIWPPAPASITTWDTPAAASPGAGRRR